MTLDPRLSTALSDRYRIERELGAGGMATVYLAEDLKHGRKVAIKVLRPELAAVIGAERFLREIKTIATLQHPHILGLIDSGEVNGTAYFVMPFVDGESLRDRLTREKQLPIGDAVRLATEVAGALDYAHRHGVIHRDIKPENIMLHDGSALVADFGIALAASKAGGSRMTETGMSLGTPHYMSPEQAMGEREITARSDVYALGAMTYETLIGEPPFTGPTAQAIVARVMTEVPRSLRTQRPTVPPEVEDAVLTALQKLPADRFASVAEFATALTGAVPRRSATTTRLRAPVPPANGRWKPAAAGAVLVLVSLAAGYGLGHRVPVALPIRSTLLPPPGCTYASVAAGNVAQLSPDGSMLAFVASCGGTEMLWIRNLATGEMRQVNGTQDALSPFWSPDSRSLGIFSAEHLKRIDLQSGAIRDLAVVVTGRGGSWNRDGTILYAPDIAGPILSIPAEGGTPVVVIPGDARVTNRLPYFLPDGRDFLYVRSSLDSNTGAVRAGRLGVPGNHSVLDLASNVAYGDGHLLYALNGLLMAHKFDAGKGAVSGAAASLVPGLENYAYKFLGNFSISSTRDLLVYQSSQEIRSRVTWFDPRSGRSVSLFDSVGASSLRVSPKGDAILIERSTQAGGQMELWLYRIAGAGWTRVSGAPDLDYAFAWSPDGSQFVQQRAGDTLVHVVTLDRDSERTFPATGKSQQAAMEWSPDGSYLLGWRQSRATGFDIIRTPLSGPPVSTDLFSNPGNDVAPRLSPDGRLLAFISDRTGRPELYLARMPEAREQHQVSFEGARILSGYRSSLAWAHDGRSIYFISVSDKLMSAAILDETTLSVAKPVDYPTAPGHLTNLDAAPDGRLLLVSDLSAGAVPPLTLVEHWPGLLESH